MDQAEFLKNAIRFSCWAFAFSKAASSLGCTGYKKQRNQYRSECLHFKGV
jgi:hypothetical protein